LPENPELFDLSLFNSYIKSQKPLTWSFYQYLLEVDVSVYKNEVYQPRFVEYFALRFKTMTSILKIL
jgi:hypothetical protein